VTTTTTAVTTTTSESTTTTTAPVEIDAWTRPDQVPSSSANEPTGNFRTFCRPSALGFIDPIVSPGVPSMHLHQLFGNTSVDVDSTYESLLAFGDSTCDGGPLNRTVYWPPAMLDADGRVVVPIDMQIYYKAQAYLSGSLADRQASIAAVQPLPAGLRMVSDSYRFRCENGGPSSQRIPDTCNGGKLLAEVFFPSCWAGIVDGEPRLDSADHRSHMAFPVRDPHWGNLTCPASHPVQLVEITEIITYPAATDQAGWRLSSDLAMGSDDGLTMHADWFGAWDPRILDRWHRECVQAMRNCGGSQLGDGTALAGSAPGMGPGRVSGWTPTP
jgi:hypothetical protein